MDHPKNKRLLLSVRQLGMATKPIPVWGMSLGFPRFQNTIAGQVTGI